MTEKNESDGDRPRGPAGHPARHPADRPEDGPENLARKLIRSHLVSGSMTPGEEISIRIDQTLTQDATGTMVMLELEAMKLGRVHTELSAQYVDHNLLQTDHKNPDDHLFLRDACARHGIWYSPAGSGVSHPVHMERFGVPGRTLLGSDSHTPAAGSLGMLAMGAGGLAVALAMAGEPFHFRMPEIMGVRLTGELPDWVSAKDVILEMLRRYDVDGGTGRIIEYYGPGLAGLSAMDRHVIANMGTELGATTSVFPADEDIRRFLAFQGREQDFVEMMADEGAEYDHHDEIDLGEVEPLIALPSSPGNVRRVADVAGEPIYQAYIGSSANPGLRDMAVPALMVEGRTVHDRVSFDINPTSRQNLVNLMNLGHMRRLITAGARIHQTGCNGCIGMGQAPATNEISLRTVPRNFPGRSGTADDRVYLCSPETATASALTGVITDPRTIDMDVPVFDASGAEAISDPNIRAPADDGTDVEVRHGPNIVEIPRFDGLPKSLELPVILKVGDDISTDEIMPAGSEVLPFRSNIPEISRFVFGPVDASFPDRAREYGGDGVMIVAGDNYGQGSSREHAALAPRYLGVRVVLAKRYARIHWENLCNFGILPLTFLNADDYTRIDQEDVLRLPDVREAVEAGPIVRIENESKGESYEARHDLSPRQTDMLMKGSLLAVMRERLSGAGTG